MTHDYKLTTPVAFFIFNRPVSTERVFEEIRKARPTMLLVVADGPRPQRQGEVERCLSVRKILERVDWPCELRVDFSDVNLGCRMRVSSGLDWVFSQTEEAIILEDDCLPDPTFFRFCQELLDHYRHDERIMMISGTNVLGRWQRDNQSYHFSWYGGVWGWASWRRAWRHYDLKMTQWHDPVVKRHIRETLASSRHYRMRASLFDKVAAGKIDTWDYQWSFARLARSGLSVVPSVNLISNIGFGSDATHTTNAKTDLASMAISPASFPIRWNCFISADRDYDEAFIKLVTSQQTLLMKLHDVARIVFGRLKRLLR